MSISRKAKLIIVVIFFLVVTFHLLRQTSKRWIHKSDLSTLGTYNKMDPKNSVIHVVQLIRGTSAAYRAITMIKSLLYYQGRCRTERPTCCVGMVSSTGCQMNLTQRKQQPIPLHFHVVRDPVAAVLLDALFSSWRNRSFVYSLYDLNACVRLVEWIPNQHRSGPAALCKMFLPSILPTTLDKVIFIDTDTLLNHDIQDLWKHFEKFTESQLFAMAWEQQSPEPDCKHKITLPIPPYGLNSGVVLMHLDRMREFGWDEMRSAALATVLGESGYLRVGEQDIFNKLVSWFSHIYYQLPCEWNTQLLSEVATSCCPTVWPDRLPAEVDCITRSSPGTQTKPSLIRLAHFDLSEKPEDPHWNPISNKSHKSATYRLSRTELITRFTEMYTRFRAIPLDCLI